MFSSLWPRLGILVHIIERELLKLFWIFPIRDNRILFQSFEAANGYNDNPKYLCDYLNREYPGRYELIFTINRKNDLQLETIKRVNYRSIKWLYYLATARVVVVNVRMSFLLSRRKNQLVINTWHAGGAYKRTGLRDNTDLLTHQWMENKRRKYNNLLISSSEKFTKYNIEESMKYTGQILKCGMPRNDAFFDPQAVAAMSKKVRKELNIEDAYCVLYAPTFRKNSTAVKAVPPFQRIVDALKEKSKNRVVIMVRKHHYDPNIYEFFNTEPYLMDVTLYPDMQELLCCADMLITDYSSSIWDYAILGKPCFLYTLDLEEYEKEDRGFFTPVDKWPGIVCRDDDELVRAVKETTTEKAKIIARNHMEYMGSYESGHASRLISEYINDYLAFHRNPG